MVGRSVWVLALDAALEGVEGVILIDDVRFEGEAQYVRERGVLVHVSGRTQFTDDHESERGVSFHEGRDWQALNTGTLAGLNECVTDLVRAVLP